MSECSCTWKGNEVVGFCGAHVAHARKMFTESDTVSVIEQNAFKAGYKAGVLLTAVSDDTIMADYTDYQKRNEYGNESRFS